MQFFSSLFGATSSRPRPSLETHLVGKRVILRMGDPADWRYWRQMREMSRSFLVPWEPTWSRNGLSYSFFCGMLRRSWCEWRQGTTYAFFIFLRNPDDTCGALIGGINLNDVQRGIAQKGTLGYWIGQPYARQGLMTDAAQQVCNFAFNTLKLNRVEASCLPHNEPSKALLTRLGFTQEGYARDYLQINGEWEDHLMWGKVRPSPTQTSTL